MPRDPQVADPACFKRTPPDSYAICLNPWLHGHSAVNPCRCGNPPDAAVCVCGAPAVFTSGGCAEWPACVKPDSDAREVPVRIPGFDAMEWVKFWRETIAEHPDIPGDDGAMLGWFANAIMRGYDEYPRRPRDDQVSVPLPLAQRILAALELAGRDGNATRALAAELRDRMPK